jgi:ferredoxin
LRVAIDWDLCIGSGLCVAASDGAFAVVDVDTNAGCEPRAILRDGTVALGPLLAAARACPMQAIRLAADAEQVYPPPDGAITE